MDRQSRNTEKARKPKNKSFDIVRAAKSVGVVTLLAGARMAGAVSTQSVKDTLNLAQIANGPMEIPKVDYAARAHFEKLGENPDKLVRAVERYTRRKDLSSSKKISKKPKEDTDDKTSTKELHPYERKNLMLGAMLKVAQEDKTAAREFGKMVKDAHLRKILSLNTSPTSSIAFVHGFRFVNGPLSKGAPDGFDCTAYWSSLPSSLSGMGWQGDYRFLKYYGGDYNHFNGVDQSHSADLHDSLYSAGCASWSPGFEGTNDESLDHLSCLFAQYLYNNFGQSNSPVAIIAHSMGGIIVRNALARVQTDGGQGVFPTSIGQVTDVITINTPHTGIEAAYTGISCGGCQQTQDLVDSGQIMTYLRTQGRNPQASSVETDWTAIGSTWDPVIGNAEIGNTGDENAVDMNARHAIIYDYPHYDHTNGLSDTDVTSRDATQYYCDTTNPDNNPCGTNIYATNWNYRTDGPHMVPEIYTELTGDAS